MKDFDALKSIWNGQVEEPKIHPEEILKRVKKSKRNFSNKLLFEIGGMGLVIMLLAIIWFNTHFEMWTTHLSMAIFIICCLYYIFVQLRDYNGLNNKELLLTPPPAYIDYLKLYKKERYILNTRKYRIYSLFIGIAFGLYFIEVYFVAPLWTTISGVIFTMVWFVLSWKLMQVYIQREEEKLEEMIKNLERLQKQFEIDN